ncbi:MAG: NADH-quinone oxidoreductase subunit C [Coriobacteriales bacterium]|jgi:ech hydrogenase subunit D
MRFQDTKFIQIDAQDILGIATAKRADDWRFLEVHANRPNKEGKVEIVWSFFDDRALQAVAYEAFVDPGSSVDSLSGIFPCAFMFENEMHDLYDITVRNISLDYHGNFYQVTCDAPMMDRDADKPRRTVSLGNGGTYATTAPDAPVQGEARQDPAAPAHEDERPDAAGAATGE